MGTIGELFALVGLKVDKESFAATSASIASTGEELDQLKGKFNALSTGILAAPALAIAAIAAYGTSIAVSMQTASQTLETVYGDLEVAQEKFQWLKEFAASTPFEFPELLEATILLKNAGLEAEDYLTNVGNAASVFHRSVADTSHAVVSAMNGEWEAMKSFGISTVEVTSKNVESLGLSAEAIGQRALITTDKYGKQIIATVDQTNKAAVASTINDLFGKYEGQMEKTSQTIAGLWSTLSDNIGMSLAGIVGFQDDMSIRTFSLMGALQLLMEVAVSVTGVFLNMSPTVQVFVSVLGVLIATMSAAAVVASLYGIAANIVFVTGMIKSITTTAFFGTTLSAAFLPVTAIIIGVALLAAGLWELNNRTGIISNAFSFLGDLFVVVEDRFSKFWNSISGPASYAIRNFQFELEKLWTTLNDLATKIHLDDLLNFAWDLSPLKYAYEAAKKLWDILSEWGAGVSEEAATIEKANEEMGTSSEDMGKKAKTAGDDVEAGNNKIKDSAPDKDGGIVNSIVNMGKGYVGLGKDATEGAVVVDQANKDMQQSVKDTATEFDKSFLSMKTNMENMIKLRDSGIGQTSQSVSEAIVPGGKGMEVSTGNSTYGPKGMLGYDEKTGQAVLRYLKEVDGKIVEQTVSLAYLNRIGQDTFMTQDGLIRTVAFDHTTNTKELDEYIGKEREKGITVIPINMDVVRSQEAIGTATKEVGEATDDTTKKVDETVKAEQEFATISLTDAANQNRLPGTAAHESQLKVEDLDTTERDLNKVTLVPNINEVLKPGQSAETSLYKVSDLDIGTRNLNGISLSSIIGELLQPGNSSDTSNIAVGTLGLGIGALNPISLGVIIGALLGPGTSSDTSKIGVDSLFSSITGLNGIDLSSITSALKGVWQWASDAISKAKDALNIDTSSGSSGGGGGGAMGRDSTMGRSKEGVQVMPAKTTVNVKIGTQNNNGSLIGTNAVRRVIGLS